MAEVETIPNDVTAVEKLTTTVAQLGTDDQDSAPVHRKTSVKHNTYTPHSSSSISDRPFSRSVISASHTTTANETREKKATSFLPVTRQGLTNSTSVRPHSERQPNARTGSYRYAKEQGANNLTVTELRKQLEVSRQNPNAALASDEHDLSQPVGTQDPGSASGSFLAVDHDPETSRRSKGIGMFSSATLPAGFNSSDVADTPRKKRHYPSLKKGVQKRLGVGKYSQTGSVGFFGVPIDSQPLELNTGMPLFMFAALHYLYLNKAYLEEGIFRIAGGAETISRLAKLCDKSGKLLLERGVLDTHKNPHDISSLVKMWMKLLPEPLIPPSSFQLMVTSFRSTDNDDLRVSYFATHVATMPPKNRSCLKHLFYFMSLVTHHSDVNRMSLANVVSCLAPTIMRAQSDQEFLRNFEASSGCVMFLLKHLDAVFGVYEPLSFMKGHLAALGEDELRKCSIDLTLPF
eukprot:c5898_g1_i1.p1 GENE.c5898_g1_i1~~c5898_g1_i1.p1  ORF type:complete len:461 (+),score=65.69 c5898_g1_i1:160-1542(+)